PSLRGDGHPTPLRWRPPRVSPGTVAAVTLDRTVAWNATACARQVNVANIVCGVDVSAETLDAGVGLEGPSIKVARSPDGIAELAGFCTLHKVELVVMEATGGYEKLAFALLWERGDPVRDRQPQKRAPLRRGHGIPREDRPDRRP